MAFIVPALGYAFLKTRIVKFDAAVVAAAYGSVSAVTFAPHLISENQRADRITIQAAPTHSSPCGL